MFAKIFECEDGSQVVVMKKEGDDGEPEVRLYFEKIHEDLGVCETAFMYFDGDDGWDARDKKFDSIDLELIEGLITHLNSVLSGGGSDPS